MKNLKNQKQQQFDFQEKVKLGKYTTFQIGGPAKYFIEVHTVEEMQDVMRFTHTSKEKFLILGKGSNILIDDKGFDGIVILNKISEILWSDRTVKVGAGYSFALLGTQSTRKKFSGLEFAPGIPGSVGGAIFMNAGANKMEVKDVVMSVEYVNETGDIVTFSRDEIEFKYRFSMFHQMKGSIVSATFNLQPSNCANEMQKKMINYRMSTQPYKDKTFGCAFTNPTNQSAGKLIEDCGLKKTTVGGASVSDKHANFIVNSGNATTEDVKELLCHIQIEIKKKTGITLEREVRFVSFDGENNE